MFLVTHIASMFFMYISFNSVSKERNRRKKLYYSILDNPNNLWLNIVTNFSLIISSYSVCEILSISWYWCILINLIGILILSPIIGLLFRFLIRISEQEYYNPKTQESFFIRSYMIDANTTLFIGVVLFCVSFIFK